MEFQANIPIYLQVVDHIRTDIMNGKLKPNDKLPSVRELALELGVNPNTIQRAYGELEKDGFIYTERAVGKYVADNAELIKQCRNEKIREIIDEFKEKMLSLGIDEADIITYLKENEK